MARGRVNEAPAQVPRVTTFTCRSAQAGALAAGLSIVVVVATPVPARLAGGLLTRPVTRLALHLDDPAAFVAEAGTR